MSTTFSYRIDTCGPDRVWRSTGHTGTVEVNDFAPVHAGHRALTRHTDALADPEGQARAMVWEGPEPGDDEATVARVTTRSYSARSHMEWLRSARQECRRIEERRLELLRELAENRQDRQRAEAVLAARAVEAINRHNVTRGQVCRGAGRGPDWVRVILRDHDQRANR